MYGVRFREVFGLLFAASFVCPDTCAEPFVCCAGLPVWLGLGNDGSCHAPFFIQTCSSTLQGMCSRRLILQGFARRIRSLSSCAPSPKAHRQHGSLDPGDANNNLRISVESEEGTLVQNVDARHDYLLRQKLAWQLNLSCDFIGVHPENRDGLGMCKS